MPYIRPAIPPISTLCIPRPASFEIAPPADNAPSSEGALVVTRISHCVRLTPLIAETPRAPTVLRMARNCTTNVKGSHVFYKDPITGRIAELTRGRILPVGVTRLVAQPYGVGMAAPAAEEFELDTRPGTFVYTTDGAGRLVHHASGPPLDAAAQYPRSAADHLLGELRGHIPSAHQAEILRKVDYLRRKFDVLRGTLPAMRAADRAIYQATGITPRGEAGDNDAAQLYELVQELDDMSYRSAFSLSPRLDLDRTPDDDVARYTQSPIETLLFDARCLQAARYFGLEFAEVVDIANNVTPVMLTPADIDAREEETLQAPPWCVHVVVSSYNDNYTDILASQIDSVWPTRAEAEARQRAYEIHASIVDDESDASISVEVFAWPAGQAPELRSRTAEEPAPRVSTETTFEHGSVYVVYEEHLDPDFGSARVTLDPVGLYATAAEAQQAANDLGTWVQAHLDGIIDDSNGRALDFYGDDSREFSVSLLARDLAHLGTAGSYYGAHDIPDKWE